MSKIREKGLETSLADFLINPKKYAFGFKDL